MKMKTPLLFLLYFIPITSFSQSIIYSEGFEGSTGMDLPAGWEVLSSSSINETPEVVNFPNFWDNWWRNDPSTWGATYVHTGIGSAAVGGTSIDPDPTWSWLVSNEINLPNVELLEIRYWFWYWSSQPSYFTDFRILLQEEGSTDWIEVERIYVDDETVQWFYVEEMFVDISEFKNKNVKMAFVHNSTYQFALDDISVFSNDVLSIVNNNISESLKLFPNPAANKINLTIANNISVDSIYIYDVFGRSIEVSINNNSLDISFLTSGVYTLSIETTLGRINKKFIKK